MIERGEGDGGADGLAGDESSFLPPHSVVDQSVSIVHEKKALPPGIDGGGHDGSLVIELPAALWTADAKGAFEDVGPPSMAGVDHRSP